jgi:hypothetical protein
MFLLITLRHKSSGTHRKLCEYATQVERNAPKVVRVRIDNNNRVET